MSTTPLSRHAFASTLPGRYYFEPGIFAQEQARIFSRLWVCVGRTSELPHAGDYRTIQLGAENIILLRGKDHRLRAFLNVCRHRGARLCSQEQGHLKGSLQCRYHAWTYALDGSLLGAPNVLNNPDFEKSTYGLLPVALEIWEGCIWLNLEDDPPPLAEQVLPPIIERFGSYEPFTRYTPAQLESGQTLVYEVKANWKILLENFMECYHCAPLHPEFCDLLPDFRSGQTYIEGEAATLAPEIEAFNITGRATRRPLPGLFPEDLRRYYGIVVMPNVLLNLLDDHLVIHILSPIDATHTHVTCTWLFDPQEMEKETFDPQDAVALFDLVNRQDWEVCELTQQGMTSKAFRNGGIYVPNEQHIRTFCDFVLAQLA